MGKFVIKQGKKGFTFNLKAKNGEVIATSEVYSEKSSCKNGIKSVINCSAVANIEDQTTTPVVETKNPKFEIYLDRKKEFRFRLKAKNGEIIAMSEGYSSKANCQKGIASVKDNSANSEIVEE